jgi:hypothetical protein
MKRLLAGFALLTLVIYGCDPLAGLPPDIVGFIIIIVVAFAAGVAAYLVERWGRG